MPPSPGTYLTLRRRAAGLSVADAAAAISTEPRLAEHARAEWIEKIEADVVPASFHTIAALRAVYPFDLGVLAQLALIHLGVALPAPAVCKRCGCSWNDPCEGLGGCYWYDAEQTLCSVCAPRTDGSAVVA